MSRCYTQITLADRRRLHHLVAAKVPVNEMARQLGRHRSTRRSSARGGLEDGKLVGKGALIGRTRLTASHIG